MRQLVYQVCYTRYHVSFYLWLIGSSLKHCKVPKYYDHNCSSVLSVASSVQSPTSRVQRPESSVQSPASRVQIPASRVQRPESSVQRPESSVQRPESSVQSPASNSCLQSPGIPVCQFTHLDLLFMLSLFSLYPRAFYLNNIYQVSDIFTAMVLYFSIMYWALQDHALLLLALL